MEKSVCIFYLLSLLVMTGVLASCDKEPENINAGQFTIDNTLYGNGPYYAIGYSFEQGRELQTNEAPGPDITVHAKTDAQGTVSGAYLDTPNLTASFALAGDFNSVTDAKSFFDDLLTLGNYSWMLFADGISENQVYVFETRKENYVKFRIIDLVLDDNGDGPYAEVTIEWRIQPDGSTTFSQ